MRMIATTRCCSIVLLALAVGAASGQDLNKGYKELDQDATKLFKDGNYKQAHRIWKHVHRDYSRAEFANLKEGDPRFVAWQHAFYASIIREGLAKKQVMLQSKDATERAKADEVYTRAVEAADAMMERGGLTKQAREKLTKAAAKPLLDALKKREEDAKKD